MGRRTWNFGDDHAGQEGIHAQEQDCDAGSAEVIGAMCGAERREAPALVVICAACHPPRVQGAGTLNGPCRQTGDASAYARQRKPRAPRPSAHAHHHTCRKRPLLHESRCDPQP
jgi:hypothetical protein